MIFQKLAFKLALRNTVLLTRKAAHIRFVFIQEERDDAVLN